MLVSFVSIRLLAECILDVSCIIVWFFTFPFTTYFSLRLYFLMLCCCLLRFVFVCGYSVMLFLGIVE